MENLSPRETEILKLISKGFENSMISKEMNLSVHTIKVYISSIFYKLKAKNRTEAAFIAGKYKLVN